MKHFEIHDELSSDQKSELRGLLYDNRDVFVTKENPSKGFTDLVQHRIILKPDFKPLQQKPYRFNPEKREILQHHIEELLKQGFIAEMDANEDVPITNPIVLVEKRTKPIDSTQTTDKKSSLRQYIFCVDYRYLNTVFRVI